MRTVNPNRTPKTAPAGGLGSRIYEARRRRGLTQRELAGGDFSLSYISAVERGKIRPSLPALQLLAQRLGEPVSYFLSNIEEQTTPQMHAEDLLTEVATMITSGEYETALVRLQETKVEGLGPTLQALYHYELGRALLGLNRLEEAMLALEEAVHLSQERGEQTLATQARNILGQAYFRAGKPALAIEYHRHCLDAIEKGEVDDPLFRLSVYANLTSDQLVLGQYEDAIINFQSVEKLASRVTSTDALADLYQEMAGTARAAGDARRARLYTERSLILHQVKQNQLLAIEVYNVFGRILLEAGEFAQAQSCFHNAVTLAQVIGNETLLAQAQVNQAELHLRQERYNEAEELANATIETGRRHNDPLLTGQALLVLGRVYASQGRRQEAEEAFLSSIHYLQGTHACDLLSKAYFRLGQAFVTWGDAKRAAEYLEKAYLTGRH